MPALFRRPRAVLLATCLLVVPALLAGSGASAPSMATLWTKADPALRDALEAELSPLDVIVLGPALTDVRPLATRAQTIAALDARSAPWLDAARGLAQDEGAHVLAAWSTAPAIKVRADAAALAALAARPDVRSLTLDSADAVRVATAPAPQDGAAGQNTGGRRMVQAEEIWAMGWRGEGIRIAIIDTGIDPSHEAFRNADGSSRVVAWRDFVQAQPQPYDDFGHGTYMAAAAAGSATYDDPTWGAFQEAGVAPAADLVVAKFLSASGSGSYQDAIDSLNWAFAEGANVTSNSWGSACTSSAIPTMAVMRTLRDAGMVSVASVGASGPSGGTISAPACSESVIGVGAIAQDHTIHPPSARGPCSDIEIGGAPRVCPDLVAKGVDVRSAVPRGACSWCDASGYRAASVTSAAAPAVAGAVALIEQLKVALTGHGWDTASGAEEEVLKQTALDLGTTGPDDTYGWGLPQLVNVHALLSQTPEARIVATLSPQPVILREGDSVGLRFGVQNLGGASATGRFVARHWAPDGTERVLADENVTLGLLDKKQVEETFVVTRDVPAGIHAFRGAYLYEWTNATTGEVVRDVVSRGVSFDVRRVVVHADVEGLADVAGVGEPQRLRVVVRNDGNEDASSVVLRFTYADAYVPLPGDGFDAQRLDSRHSSPAPDAVTEDRDFGRVTYAYEVGALAQGGTFSFETTLVPTEPGVHRFVVAVAFCDEGGNCATAGDVRTQHVTLPIP